jgi:hypothetical protein
MGVGRGKYYSSRFSLLVMYKIIIIIISWNRAISSIIIIIIIIINHSKNIIITARSSSLALVVSRQDPVPRRELPLPTSHILSNKGITNIQHPMQFSTRTL